MRITASGDTFVGIIRFDEREVLRLAKWKWSFARKRWETTIPAQAAEFAPFMDPAARALLARWKTVEGRALEMSHASTSDAVLPVPAGLEPRPFQTAGVVYALGKNNVLFADPPGLGKTIQAIVLSNATPTPVRHVLVVCPASLKINWEREWKKWDTRGLSVGIAGTKPERYKDADGKSKTRSVNVWPDTGVVIVNYDILERFQPQIQAIEWDYLVVDEAHYLQNADSKRTQNILGHLKKVKGKWKWLIPPIPSKRRAFLTGTPMLGAPEGMFALIRACDKDGLGRNFMDFAYQYCGAHEGSFGLVTNGASNLDELQRLMRERFMVSRNKREVLTELPDKQRELIVLPRDGLVKLVDRETGAYQGVAEMLMRYEAVLRGQDPDEAVAEAEVPQLDLETLADVLAQRFGHLVGLPFGDIAATLGDAGAAAFEELATARRELAIAKLPMILQQSKNILNAGEKLIIFGVHKEVCRALRDTFPGCAYVTGEVPSAKRQGQIDMFQTDDACRVAVGNIHAMGVGYTMTAAAHVDFAELHWVPADMEQAEDRAWRIGQKNAVLARHFAVEGTMDARLVEVFIRKAEVAAAALDRKKEET